MPKPSASRPAPSASPAPYPAPTPADAPLPTEGQPSINTARVITSVRMRFNPLRNLTPQRLTQYLEQFDLGFFRQVALVWDRLERRDYTIKTVAPKRKKAVARRGYEIVTVAKPPPGLETLAEQQADELQYFYDNLTATDALQPDQRGGLALLARQMMDAQAKYYACHELVWQPSPKGLTAQFVFCPLWWFEGTQGKLRYLDSEFQIYGRDMLPAEWLVTVGEGLMEATSVAWMFKHLSLSDWLAYCEKFGTPFVDVATSAQPGSKEWEQLVDYASNFGPDGGGVRNQSANITLLEPKAAGIETYAAMVENMDRAIVKLWRGGDLGTSSGKDKTGASLQQDETEILETDDAVLIEETLATQVSRFVVAYHHGADAPVLAYLKFRRADNRNITQDLAIDKFLLTAGAPLTVKATLERYARPCPDDVAAEALLTPSARPEALGAGREEDLPPGAPGLAPNASRPAPDFANVSDTELLAGTLGQTLSELLLPLLHRLEAIAQVDDAALRQHLLAKLLKDFPAVAEAIRRDNSLAQQLSPALASALVAGSETSPPNFTNGDLPGHEFHGNQYTDAVGKINDVLGGKTQRAIYAQVSPETAAKIKAVTQQDVSDHQHAVDRSAVNHILRRHGEGREKQPGHEPVTEADLQKIPQIVNHPDSVTQGKKSGTGMPSVVYAKRFNGTTYYVEERWPEKKIMAAKTMYKHTHQ